MLYEFYLPCMVFSVSRFFIFTSLVLAENNPSLLVPTRLSCKSWFLLVLVCPVRSAFFICARRCVIIGGKNPAKWWNRLWERYEPYCLDCPLWQLCARRREAGVDGRAVAHRRTGLGHARHEDCRQGEHDDARETRQGGNRPPAGCVCAVRVARGKRRKRHCWR